MRADVQAAELPGLIAAARAEVAAAHEAWAEQVVAAGPADEAWSEPLFGPAGPPGG